MTQPPTSPGGAGPEPADPGGAGFQPAGFNPRCCPPPTPGADRPIGGRIKQRPEDFIVEEIPAYEPCGQGEHLYLFVQKTGLATLQLIRLLARHFNVHPSAVGHAGLKDRQAVTRQLISIHTPGRRLQDFPPFQHDRAAVLWADHHTNKLRTGHLKGNRFSIRIRGVDLSAVLRARDILARLAREGVPNRFGPQRFGSALNNHLVGRALILGDADAAISALLGPSPFRPEVHEHARQLFAQGRYDDAEHAFPAGSRTERALCRALAAGAGPRSALARIPRGERQFFISAFQSAVFNAVLDQRLAGGTLATLIPGDLAFRHDNGAVFPVLHPDNEPADRLKSFQISPSGPMWGPKMTRAAGAVDRAEVQALMSAGLDPEHVGNFPRDTPGARRPLRVPLIDPDVEAGADAHGPYIRCAFELPRGAFATAVMMEVMGDTDPPHSEESDQPPKHPDTEQHR